MLLLALILASGCAPSAKRPDPVVRVGFFANVTHAPLICALADGSLQDALPQGWRIEPRVFAAGPELMVALASGSLDVACVGPVPYLTAKARGVPVTALAGISRGGARLVRSGDAAGGNPRRSGRLVALVPQFGNTQDIQLRILLEGDALREGGGASVQVAQANPADAGVLLRTGQVQMALLPEPWAALLVREGTAVEDLSREVREFLQDSPVAVLVASDEFARREPQVLRALVEAFRESVRRVNSRPEESALLAQREIARWTRKQLPDDVALSAFSSCVFDDALDGKALEEMARASQRHGYLPQGEGVVERLLAAGGKRGGL